MLGVVVVLGDCSGAMPPASNDGAEVNGVVAASSNCAHDGTRSTPIARATALVRIFHEPADRAPLVMQQTLPGRRAAARMPGTGDSETYPGTVADKETGGAPDTGSSPFDDPTLQMRRERPSMLESEDDLGFDNSALDNSGYSAPYAAPTEQIHQPAAAGPVDTGQPPVVKARRGTLDLGLLVLRLAVGGILIVHGLQKLVGLWGGPGLDGFEETLREAGYQQPNILAIVAAAGELAAGAFLVLGLLTPLAAAAIVAIMINAVLFKHELEPGLQFFASEQTGFEFEALLVAAAVSLTLTGPGRIAVDGPRKWATRPFLGSFVALLLGVAAGVCLWIFGR